MSLKNIRHSIAFCFLISAATVSFAQHTDQRDSFALRVYYSDLYLALENLELEDVPFRQKQVEVQSNDSLLKLAEHNRIAELDSIHFVAALYEANPQAFDSGEQARLVAGSTLKMPSVGDIFYAQERYEKLKIAGNSLDVSGDDNPKHNELQQPLGKSILAIGSSTRDELPGHQVVTLSSSYADHAIAGALTKEQATEVNKLPSNIKSLAESGLLSAKAIVPESRSVPAVEVVRGKEADRNSLLVDTADPAMTSEAGSAVAAETTGKPSQRGVVGAARVTATPDTDNNEKVGDPDVKIAAALPVAEPQIARSAEAGKTGASSGDIYLGPPKNSSTASLKASTDPLNSVIEWKFNSDATIGTVLSKLAEYVGYELTIADEGVRDAYTRRLPTLQRSISGITAEDGFTMLAGRGLETVFDHVSRSVEHQPRSISASMSMVDKQALSAAHKKIVQASGTSSLLQQFPTDISIAAERHAERCESSASTALPDAARLYDAVVGKFQLETPDPIARNLVEWYESSTGRKVLELEKQQIDDAELQQFSMDDDRADRISKIYEHTVTGKGIANIAVELDYAGWLLSGCKQQAENTRDIKKMNQEILHGQGIKKKLVKLEAILREDMLQSLAYQLSSLTERELTEYADIITTHAGVYSAMEQSIVHAVELEINADSPSSLD